MHIVQIIAMLFMLNLALGLIVTVETQNQTTENWINEFMGKYGKTQNTALSNEDLSESTITKNQGTLGTVYSFIESIFNVAEFIATIITLIVKIMIPYGTIQSLFSYTTSTGQTMLDTITAYFLGMVLLLINTVAYIKIVAKILSKDPN